MTKEQRTKNKKQIIWLLSAIIIAAVYFFGLSIPLLGPDEPRYAQVAREMFQRGDWITPKLGGFDWFEKPALLYWLQIASYYLFGVNEFAARFGSALFGLGTVFSLWILGKHIENRKQKPITNYELRITDYGFANWLALISASSIGLIVFSHAASFDIILTFPITASLVGFFIFDSAQRDKTSTIQNDDSAHPSIVTRCLSLFAFYFFIGVALIAKGLVGIVFPFAIVAFYYVLSRKLPSKTFIFSLLWGTLLSLIAAAAWYLPMSQANGWKFIDEFIIQHHFQRYTSNKYLHPQPFYFFFWVLPLMTLPWLPFFLAGSWSFSKDFFSRKAAKTNDELRMANDELRAFAFAWMLVPLVFFSLSGSKLPGYILPSLPAALILTAEYVYRFIQNSEKRKNAILIAAFLSFVSVVLTLQFFVTNYAAHETVKTLIQTANQNGYENAKILSMHTISQNAEFYGAERLVRAGDGKQRRFDGVGEVIEEIKNDGKDALVLVPPEYASQLIESNLLETKVLGDNGELMMVAVKLK